MVSTAIVPKDKAQYSKLLEPDEIRRRLKKEGSYTFAYAISDEKGDIRSKNMTVSAIDLSLTVSAWCVQILLTLSGNSKPSQYDSIYL